MQNTKFSLIGVALFLALASPSAQTVVSTTRANVEFLASDKLEGREAGSQGERLAADYISAQLARIGARPLPGRADLFMPFEFTAGSRDGGSRMTVGGPSAVPGAGRVFGAPEVRALSFSDDAEVTGQVVFAGYGIVVPESQNFGYDSYAAL